LPLIDADDADLRDQRQFVFKPRNPLKRGGKEEAEDHCYSMAVTVASDSSAFSWFLLFVTAAVAAYLFIVSMK
jgi:hypothetical protein